MNSSSKICGWALCLAAYPLIIVIRKGRISMSKLKVAELILLVVSAGISVIKAVIKLVEHISKQKKKPIAFA